VPNPTYFDGDLRAALIEAAVAILREEGVGGLTLRGAARRAGVSHAAPAHHVGDLAGLYAAVAVLGHRTLAERMTAGAAAVSADAAPGAVLAAGVATYVRFAAERPELADPMLRRELWAAHAEEVEAELRAGYAGLRATVEAEQARGWRTGLDPDAAAQAVWALAQGLAGLRALGAFEGLDVDTEAVARALTAG
jgi:AcrR family transcriptional regulator